MQLSKKNTAIQLQRFPRQSNFFEGQSSGSKWKTEIKSLMAKNSSSERIYIGDNVQNGTNGECGTVVQFFSQEFENTHQVYASVKCESTRNISVIANDLLKLDQTNVYEGDDVERVQNLIEMSKKLDMDIYTVPINIFVDDTSGNRSKKWNPLSVWTLQLAGLPTSEKMKKSSHHFIGVTKPEDGSFITPVVNDLNDMFYEGKVMYDAAYNKNVIVTSQIAVGLMDNSMASEFCHHMGAASKENCRFCRYRNNHLLIGELRTKNKTEEILKEIENSTETSTMTGIKKKILAEEMNKAAHWDPHRDIPPDMLHCIYLGEVAILLKCMLGNCTDQQKENLQLTLNAADWKGFHHKCGENFVKYHKSSQGKDFRSFVQLAPFTVHHAGFSKEIVKLWCLLSEIVQLSNKMKLLESELTRLGDLQYQFNENIYKQFPETLKKQKIHHNLHTEQQIRLHGVPIGYTTETGESWCGIVKHFQSITNHHNANKDTALKLAHVEEVCHIIDSGTWFSNGKRVQPAQQTIEEINHPRIQTFVMGNRTQKEDGRILVLDTIIFF
ncbi:uncharacterized protein LOC127710330 [Mytilus californianus]|uniref:uncharacterized protein LOC127710330 n=1 Tax=Mytilus californianus TaxID=6549 RepID=UPI0022486539|nr:uncharacterized protein LOC127710330 [Mytilus californianus]